MLFVEIVVCKICTVQCNEVLQQILFTNLWIYTQLLGLSNYILLYLGNSSIKSLQKFACDITRVVQFFGYIWRPTIYRSTELGS